MIRSWGIRRRQFAQCGDARCAGAAGLAVLPCGTRRRWRAAGCDGGTDRGACAPDPQAALDHLLDPAVRIVTLTRDGEGLLGAMPMQRAIPRRHTRAAGLAWLSPCIRRRAAGVAPFTVLSCDNLPANGDTTREWSTRFAARLDRSLGHFVADAVAFPDCMVDRIVPATTREDRARIDAELGRAGRMAGGVRAVHPMGDRGSLPARSSRLGTNRRRTGRAMCGLTRT